MNSVDETSSPSGTGTTNTKIGPSTKNKQTPSKSRKKVTPTMKKKKQSVSFSCPHCDFESPNIVKHFAHKRQHREEEASSLNIFKCHNCNYTSKVKGGLQRHIKRVHTKERPFACPVCKYRTVDKISMTKHIVSRHPDDIGDDLAMYIDCMKSSEDKTENDMEEEGEKSSLMTIDKSDDEESASKTDEDQYMEASASKAKHVEMKSEEQVDKDSSVESQPPIAKLLSREYFRKRDYEKYRKFYATPEYRAMRNLKLTCDYCKKICSSRRELSSHTNTHRDTNLHCPICHKFLVDKNERMLHVKSHTESYNYLCSTCLCSFEQESSLLHHQQSEHRKSINLIMECMFCPFSSRSQERFARHMTRYHMAASDSPKHNPFNLQHLKTLLDDWIKSISDELPVDDNLKGDSSDQSQSKSPLAGESFETKDLQDLNLTCDPASLLDYSFLDDSVAFNESVDNLEEYLEKNENFIGFDSSSDNQSLDQISNDDSSSCFQKTSSDGPSIQPNLPMETLPQTTTSSGGPPRYSGSITKGMRKFCGDLKAYSHIAANSQFNFSTLPSPDSTSGAKE